MMDSITGREAELRPGRETSAMAPPVRARAAIGLAAAAVLLAGHGGAWAAGQRSPHHPAAAVGGAATQRFTLNCSNYRVTSAMLLGTSVVRPEFSISFEVSGSSGRYYAFDFGKWERLEAASTDELVLKRTKQPPPPFDAAGNYQQDITINRHTGEYHDSAKGVVNGSMAGRDLKAACEKAPEYIPPEDAKF